MEQALCVFLRALSTAVGLLNEPPFIHDDLLISAVFALVRGSPVKVAICQMWAANLASSDQQRVEMLSKCRVMQTHDCRGGNCYA